MKTPYATRYKTTLAEDEQAIADKAHGKNATPVLHKDLSSLGLVKENCQRKSRVLAREIMKSLMP